MTGQAASIWIPYCGAAPLPAEWWLRWNFDPMLLVALAALALLWFKFGPNTRPARRAGAWALVTAVVLFVSPLCALSSALFSARVVHHVLLATLLAPLLVAALDLRGAPGSLAAWTAAQALTFWAWHAPPLYEAALSNDAIYWAMQLSITATATMWWAKVLRADAGAGVLALLATMVQMGLLGAILTFAGRAFYAPHWLTTQAWGLTPLEDQQVAGLIMWAPASAIYLLTAVAILYRSLEPVRAR